MEKIAKQLSKLNEKEILAFLKKFKRKFFTDGYIKGYWARNADLRAFKKNKEKRLRKEYEERLLEEEKESLNNK